MPIPASPARDTIWPRPRFTSAKRSSRVPTSRVLPQSPGDAWRHIDADTANAYYRRIGNLVLLRAGANAAVGNEAFQGKKPQYAASEFRLTSEVATFGSWGPEDIEKRQAALAKVAVKTWPFKL